MAGRRPKSTRQKQKEGNPGKPVGAVNKTTRAVKEVFAQVFNELQEDPEKDYHLSQWAKKNSTEFYKLSSKLIPLSIGGDVDNPLVVAANISKEQIVLYGDIEDITLVDDMEEITIIINTPELFMHINNMKISNYLLKFTDYTNLGRDFSNSTGKLTETGVLISKDYLNFIYPYPNPRDFDTRGYFNEFLRPSKCIKIEKSDTTNINIRQFCPELFI